MFEVRVLSDDGNILGSKIFRTSSEININSPEVLAFLEEVSPSFLGGETIEITKGSCCGCDNDLLGQEEHMDCPFGCLHGECEMCQ